MPKLDIKIWIYNIELTSDQVHMDIFTQAHRVLGNFTFELENLGNSDELVRMTFFWPVFRGLASSRINARTEKKHEDNSGSTSVPHYLCSLNSLI